MAMRIVLLFLAYLVYVFIGACVLAYANYRIEQYTDISPGRLNALGHVLLLHAWPFLLLLMTGLYLWESRKHS